MTGYKDAQNDEKKCAALKIVLDLHIVRNGRRGRDKERIHNPSGKIHTLGEWGGEGGGTCPSTPILRARACVERCNQQKGTAAPQEIAWHGCGLRPALPG